MVNFFSGLDKAKKQRPKSYQGILRCRPKNSEAVGMRSGAHGGLMCPFGKGVGGLRHAGPGICDCKYVEDAKAAHIVRVWGNSLTTWRNSTDRRINRA